MPLPTFFVIGAAKAGTTALADALGQHPDVFMSPLKEPFFFALDGEPQFPDPAGRGIVHRMVWRAKDYMALFAGAKGETAIGEATPLYLRSIRAADRIQHNLPDSKLIAILRQPAERAYSNYLYMVMHGVEAARSLAAALDEEAQGLRDAWFSGVRYQDAGYYFRQLRAYYDRFPSAQIKVCLHEDWLADPRGLMRELFGFLGVDPAFEPGVRRLNATYAPRSRKLHRWAQAVGRAARGAGASSVSKGATASLAWLDQTCNLRPPPPLDPDLRRRLTGAYRDDITALQDLIGRDLSRWLA